MTGAASQQSPSCPEGAWVACHSTRCISISLKMCLCSQVERHNGKQTLETLLPCVPGSQAQSARGHSQGGADHAYLSSFTPKARCRPLWTCLILQLISSSVQGGSLALGCPQPKSVQISNFFCHQNYGWSNSILLTNNGWKNRPLSPSFPRLNRLSALAGIADRLSFLFSGGLGTRPRRNLSLGRPHGMPPGVTHNSTLSLCPLDTFSPHRMCTTIHFT